jgi:hypothetical protein
VGILTNWKGSLLVKEVAVAIVLDVHVRLERRVVAERVGAAPAAGTGREAGVVPGDTVFGAVDARVGELGEGEGDADEGEDEGEEVHFAGCLVDVRLSRMWVGVDEAEAERVGEESC